MSSNSRLAGAMVVAVLDDASEVLLACVCKKEIERWVKIEIGWWVGGGCVVSGDTSGCECVGAQREAQTPSTEVSNGTRWERPREVNSLSERVAKTWGNRKDPFFEDQGDLSFARF